MIVCGNPDLLKQIQTQSEIQASFGQFSDLQAYLCEHWTTGTPAGPVILEYALLPEERPLLALLSHLHTLSGHRVILLCHPQEAQVLASFPRSFEQIQTILLLPLNRTSLLFQLRQFQLQQNQSQLMQEQERRLVQLLQENRRLQKKLQLESNFTEAGLMHQQALYRRLKEEFRRAHRFSQPVSAIRFAFHSLSQLTPEEYQAFESDLAVQLNAVRASDIAGHLDEQSFLLLLPMTCEEGCAHLVERFQTRLDQVLKSHPLPADDYTLHWHTLIPQTHDQIEALLEQLFPLQHQSQLCSV